ncbi:MAG: ABC transporter permease [Candidatus Bathyarchaeia archaeon]|nr:ABC transporter permease [Candidatus Bathyarchaeota archaeon]
MNFEDKSWSREPKLMRQLWAVIKYELLWNIRKKKFLGVLIVAFAITTLNLTLPVILRRTYDMPIESNPNYIVSNSGIGGLMLFLFALVTVMNSISGEFESGTIVPLLTKPISRTLILIGKIAAAFITIFAAYLLLYTYMIVGGTIIYGPQNNLDLTPLCILGDLLSTFVWVSIILALGSLTKNTILTSVIAIMVFLAMNIGSSIISVFTESAWMLHYLPGNGAAGYIKVEGQPTAYAGSISTGTDNITKMIIQYYLHPSANVTYVKVELRGGSPQGGLSSLLKELYSEPLSLVLFRAISVAAAYIIALITLAWYIFKRAQILE